MFMTVWLTVPYVFLYIRSFVVLCHYDRILRSEHEDPVYVGGERSVVLIHGNVSFDLFNSQIRRINGSESYAIKVIYSLKSVRPCRFLPVFLIRRTLLSRYPFMIYIMSAWLLYLSLSSSVKLSALSVLKQRKYVLPTRKRSILGYEGGGTNLRHHMMSLMGEKTETTLLIAN